MFKLIFTCLLFIPILINAQKDTLGDQRNNSTDYQVSIKKAQIPIVIDGVLDEKDWVDAVPAKDFWMKFPDNKGKYMVHCHNLEHEDDGMMLQFEIV